MKAIYKNIAIAALALSAVACTQEEDLAPSYLTDPQAVRISAQVASGYVTGGFTRSNPLGTEAEQAKFNSGDKIAVTAGTQAAVTYTFDGTDTWTPGTNQYLKWESNPMTFNAWYPVGGGINAQNFTPSYGQTASLEELQANDYMTFSEEKTKNGNDNSVSIELNRQMARIVISGISYGNQYNASTDAVASIAITAGSSKYARGAWDDTNVTAQMYQHTDGDWYAVLPPTATTESEEDFLTITLANNDELIVKGIPATEAGKTYEYTLTVGKDNATIGSVTVNEWTDGTVISGGKAAEEEEEEEEIPYLTFSSSVTQTLSLLLYTFDYDGNFINKNTSFSGNVQYSINGGEWQSLNNGQTESFGGNNGKLRLRGKCPNGTVNFNEVEFAVIEFSDKDNDVACLGDIRTLVNYENYSAAETDNARFCYLFSDCSNLTSAPELPATTLANYCYQGMFSGCSSLTSAPELPATTLAEYCYYGMFSGCSSLTSAPELPTTTLTFSCYESMFSGCSSLTTAPELRATTLADYCYQGMFSGCSRLTTAPELPVTTLAEYCYSGMFSGCSSLTSAPTLRATTLKLCCYLNMFNGCTSLNSVTMLATDISATDCLWGWLDGVATEGTFTKAAGMTSLSSGANGIPSGWTVKDYVAPAQGN